MIEFTEEYNTTESTSVKANGIPFPKDYGGVGYVYIPVNVEREKFIFTCTNTSTLSIITNEGNVYHRVPIDKVSINYIEWPNDIRQLGSPVVWMNMPYHDKPIIIGVYNSLDEYSPLEEGQFTLEKITSSGHVKISGKGNTGELFISVNGFDQGQSGLQDDLVKDIQSTSKIKGGKFYIDVQNDSGTAEFNLNVKGDINILTEGKTSIKNSKELEFEVRDEIEDEGELKDFTTKLNVVNGQLSFKIVKLDAQGNEESDNSTTIIYKKGVGLSYKDEFKNEINTSKDEASIVAKKFKLNSGKEAMVLGNTLKKLLDDILDQISMITTSTMIGQQPILNKVAFEDLKKRTKDILSQLGFLDDKDNR